MALDFASSCAVVDCQEDQDEDQNAHCNGKLNEQGLANDILWTLTANIPNGNRR